MYVFADVQLSEQVSDVRREEQTEGSVNTIMLICMHATAGSSS